MGRFLIFFSYLGTHFSGLQSQSNMLVKGKPIVTVQGVLVDAMRNLRPANDFRMILSSRTDKGVHALKNSCHVDLQYPEQGREYDPHVITHVMNYHLKKNDHEVRVLETRQMHGSFHCRLHALNRKYVYRLAHVVKDPNAASNDGGLESYAGRGDAFYHEILKFGKKRRGKHILPYGDLTSSLEARKLYVYRGTLDISRLLAAAQILSGIQNYTAFVTASNLNTGDYMQNPVKLMTIGVKRGRPLAGQLQNGIHGKSDTLEYWDIHIQGRSFLYRMVRRMVGAMVLHASGTVSLDEIQDILEHPRHDYWFYNSMVVSEAGLYLLDVEYDPEDFNKPIDESSAFDLPEPRLSSKHLTAEHS